MSDLELEGRYGTEAVESGVIQDGDLLGHVGLFDLDRATFGEATRAAREIPGPVAILSCGPGSHHLWALEVREWLSEWIEVAEGAEARRLGFDPEHSELSRQRRCSVLRIAPKVRLVDGEEIRRAPRFEDLVGVPTEPVSLSRPHYRLLREEIGREIPGLEDSPSEWIGETLNRRTYMAEIGGR